MEISNWAVYNEAIIWLSADEFIMYQCVGVGG